MEDRIYYVEGPEGEVLGPLTMIQILEGLAAEAIREDARLCEVGREEWVELSEVVSTRSGNGDHGPVDVPEFTEADFEPPAIETALVDADLDEDGLHQIQTAALHDMDLEAELRKEDLRIEPTTELDLSGISLGEEDSPTEEHVVIAPDAYLSPLSMPDSGEPIQPPREPEPEEAFPMVREAPFADLDPERTVISVPELVPADLGVTSEASAFDLPPDEGSDDFRLDLPEQSGTFEAPDFAKKRARPSWLVPALVATALPVIGILYFAWAGRNEKSIEPPPNEGEESAVVVKPATDSDREKARSFLESGRAKLAKKDAEGAVTALSKSLELDPSLHEAHKDLARALAATGRKSPAIVEMTAYLAQFTDDLEAQRSRLDWMLATGEMGEAGIIYGELASKRPESAPLQTMAGLAKGESEDAVGYLQRAIALDSTDADAYVGLGTVCAKLGRPTEAIQAFEKAFAIRRPTPSEKKLFDQAKEDAKTAKASEPSAPSTPARSPEFATARGEIEKALELQNYDDAVKAIETAKKRFGKDAEAARCLDYLRGVGEFEQGRYDQAIARFEALDDEDSFEAVGGRRGAVANWIARARMAKGDFRGAVRDFDVSQGAADPDEYATAKLWEGVALQSLGMDDLAKRTWKQIPGEVGTRVQGDGRAAVKTAQYLSGVLTEKEYLQAVSPITEFENDMHYFLGRAAQERADSATAAEHFKRSLEASRGREFPYCLAEIEAGVRPAKPAQKSGGSR